MSLIINKNIPQEHTEDTILIKGKIFFFFLLLLFGSKKMAENDS